MERDLEAENVRRLWMLTLEEAFQSAKGRALVVFSDNRKPSYRIAHLFLHDSQSRNALSAAISSHLNRLERETARVEALQWFCSDDTKPGTFLWVCDQIDLDPGIQLRKILDLWGIDPSKYNGKKDV